MCARKTLYLLGSGYSVLSGLPTMSEFVQAFQMVIEHRHLPTAQFPWLSRLEEGDLTGVASIVGHARDNHGIPSRLLVRISSGYSPTAICCGSSTTTSGC